MQWRMACPDPNPDRSKMTTLVAQGCKQRHDFLTLHRAAHHLVQEFSVDLDIF